MGLSEIVALHTFFSSSQTRTGTKSSSVLPVQMYKVEETVGLRLGKRARVWCRIGTSVCGGISRLSCRSRGRNGLSVEAGDEEK